MKTKRYRAVASIVKRTLEVVPVSCEDNTVRVYGPYPPSAGRERWRLVVMNGSVRKAVTADSEQAALLLKESLENEVSRQVGVTIEEAITDYLAFKQASVGEAWLDTLGRRLRGFMPADLTITSLTPELAQQFYDSETRRVTAHGKLVAAQTHHHLLRNVKEFFDWLVKRNKCAANPFKGVEPVGKARKGKPQLKETEAVKLDKLLFAEANDGNEGALALLVHLYGAMRSSEVLRLQVGDVEFLPNGRCRTHLNSFAQGEEGKNANARRFVDLDSCLTELLRKACGGKHPSKRVFASDRPSVPTPDYLYKRLKVFCRKAGIPEYCPHSLRGYHASTAVEAGVTSSTVAKTLGHSSFEVTQRHYATPSSVHNARAQRVAEALQAGRLQDINPDDLAAIKQLIERQP